MPPTFKWLKSDLAFIAPTGALAARIEKTRSLLKTLIDLWPDNVVPGQPIRVRWSFNLGPSLGIASVGVRFRIDGHLVFEQSGVATDVALEGTGEQVTTITIADADLRRLFYRFGPRRLDMEIDAGERNFYRTRRHFYVQPESVDASWWEWRVAVTGAVKWKQPYELAAVFHNKGQAALAVISAGLSEVRADDDPNINPCDWWPEAKDTKELTNVAPGNDAAVSFPRMHDWKWITPGAYVVRGPFSKIFAYAVSYYFTDEFGNQYRNPDTAFCSPRLTRGINVPAGKLDAGASAMAAAINAAAFAVAAAVAAATLLGLPLAAGLLTVAGVFYGLAAGAAEIAYDPPQPDPRFLEPVSVTPLPLPAWPTEGPPMPALRRLLETAARILSLENARTVTRARILGARLFGSDESLELQRSGYSRIEREMTEAAAELDQLLPAVQAEVEQVESLDPEGLAPFLDRMSRTGLPPDMHETLLKAGLRAELARGLAALPLDDTIAEVVKANGVMLAPFVASLKRFVRGVRDEREGVFAGEEVCLRPSHRDTDDTPSSDAESQPQPRRKRCCCEY